MGLWCSLPPSPYSQLPPGKKDLGFLRHVAPERDVTILPCLFLTVSEGRPPLGSEWLCHWILVCPSPRLEPRQVRTLKFP
jgi:hypothetical protein